MLRYKIYHRTYYAFTNCVTLEQHSLLLRPRESHELRIESSVLNISPSATLLWHRDIEDNCVAIACFNVPSAELLIESEVVLQQYNDTNIEFFVSDYAKYFPFNYTLDDNAVLGPYTSTLESTDVKKLQQWVRTIWSGETIETYELLLKFCVSIRESFLYTLRLEPGVQTVSETLSNGSGSCRDLAHLFMETVRSLGFAARFVSGYLYTYQSPASKGSTHAWVEVYLPGAGWMGFDPTNGELVGAYHFAVAVARLPEMIPPVSGSFVGMTGTYLDAGVWVTAL